MVKGILVQGLLGQAHDGNVATQHMSCGRPIAKHG